MDVRNKNILLDTIKSSINKINIAGGTNTLAWSDGTTTGTADYSISTVVDAVGNCPLATNKTFLPDASNYRVGDVLKVSYWYLDDDVWTPCSTFSYYYKVTSTVSTPVSAAPLDITWTAASKGMIFLTANKDFENVNDYNWTVQEISIYTGTEEVATNTITDVTVGPDEKFRILTTTSLTIDN